MTEHIYIFSGLGADERVFRNIDLTDFKHTFIHWIDPLPGESIASYATRLISQIKNDKPILIGLSFGGIVAIEVAKQIVTKKIIIISSVKHRGDLPFYYRLAGQTGLHYLIPLKAHKYSSALTNWFFGTTSKAERTLLRQITKDTNPVFVRWAVDQLLKWTNATIPNNLYHIHGTHDRLLPLKISNYDKAIVGGGHLMILNRAEEITRILKECLKAHSPI